MQLGTKKKKKMCYHWVRKFKHSKNSYAILLCASVTGKVLSFALSSVNFQLYYKPAITHLESRMMKISVGMCQRQSRSQSTSEEEIFIMLSERYVSFT